MFDGAVGRRRDESAAAGARLPQLPVAFDFEGRSALDELEIGGEFGFHLLGIGFGGSGKAKGIGSFAESGELFVGGEAYEKPHGALGGADRDQFELVDLELRFGEGEC